HSSGDDVRLNFVSRKGESDSTARTCWTPLSRGSRTRMNGDDTGCAVQPRRRPHAVLAAGYPIPRRRRFCTAVRLDARRFWDIFMIAPAGSEFPWPACRLRVRWTYSYLCPVRPPFRGLL